MGSNRQKNGIMDDMDELLAFGRMGLEMGYYEQARGYFEQVLALDSTNKEAKEALAEIEAILDRRRATVPVEPWPEVSWRQTISAWANAHSRQWKFAGLILLLLLAWKALPILLFLLMGLAGIVIVYLFARFFVWLFSLQGEQRLMQWFEVRLGGLSGMFAPRFELVHLGGVPDLKPDKKTLIRLKQDGLEIGQWWGDNRTIPYSCIENVNFAPQGFERGISFAQAAMATIIFPPAGLVASLVKRKEPMLEIEYRCKEDFVARAFFYGKDVTKLYQKLVELAAR